MAKKKLKKKQMKRRMMKIMENLPKEKACKARLRLSTKIHSQK